MELNIMSYCEQCPEFKPVCNEMSCNNAFERVYFQRVITCENYNTCKNIEKHIVEDFQRQVQQQLVETIKEIKEEK